MARCAWQRVDTGGNGTMTTNDPIVIVGAARTPMGGFQGDLAAASASELGAVSIRAALEKGGVPAEQGDEMIIGCVLSAGATTINKMCGSGMKAAMLAHDLLLAGSANVMVAGGMESMSQAPYLLPKARGGYRMGHGQVLDHMFIDGLEDAYDKGRLMGTFAEDCATTYGFTRGAQDAFAVASLTRARKATDDGAFAAEIAPLDVTSKAGTQSIARDEQPQL